MKRINYCISHICKYQKLKERQIKNIMSIDNQLYMRLINKYQKTSPNLINMIIDNGYSCDILYIYNKLTPENINHAIDIGYCLSELYTYQKLSPENIDKAIVKKNWLNILLKYQRERMNEEQIEKIRVIEEADYPI